MANDDLVHRLAAGRAYQRVALMLLRQDFVVAMHAGITEVMAPNMALRGRPLEPKDGDRPHASRPSLESVLFAQRKG